MTYIQTERHWLKLFCFQIPFCHVFEEFIYRSLVIILFLCIAL